MSEDLPDAIDLDRPEQVSIGVTRGEHSLELGSPLEHPDRADVTIEPDGTDRVRLSIDALAGDHGTGHADIELSVAEVRRLRELLDDTIRWMEAE